jgi:hypothetical protein
MNDQPDIVGAMEMAPRLGVKVKTIHVWLNRDTLPSPDYASINGSRAWDWTNILRWAGETGRCKPGSQLELDYAVAFGAKPATYHPVGRRMKDHGIGI